LVDGALAQAIGFSAPAHGDLLSICPRQAQQLFIHQKVVNDAIGALKNLFSFERQQSRVSGSCANEIDFAGCHRTMSVVVGGKKTKIENGNSRLEPIFDFRVSNFDLAAMVSESPR
jgi:hypothetical protein